MMELSTGAEYVAPGSWSCRSCRSCRSCSDNDFAPDFDHDSVFLQQNENIDTTQVIWNASATDADGDDVTLASVVTTLMASRSTRTRAR